MQAETAFNVIQALPQEELERLYGMLGVSPPEKPKRQKKKKNNALQGWSIEEITERLLATQFNMKSK